MALQRKSYETVSLLTGPEGGLEEAEVKQAMDAAEGNIAPELEQELQKLSAKENADD